MAPRSFIRRPENSIFPAVILRADVPCGTFVYSDHLGERTAGLHCSLGGIRLTVPSLAPGQGIGHTIFISCDRWYHASSLYPDVQGELGCNIIDKLGSPVLLLQQSSIGAAALVDVVGQREGRKLAKYIALVGFLEAAADMTARFSPTLRHSAKVDSDGKHMILQGTKIVGNEDWCIF